MKLVAESNWLSLSSSSSPQDEPKTILVFKSKQTGKEVCFFISCSYAMFLIHQIPILDRLPLLMVGSHYDVLLDEDHQTWACAKYYDFKWKAFANEKNREVWFRFGDDKEKAMDYEESYIIPCIHKEMLKNVFHRDDLEFVRKELVEDIDADV